MHHGLPRAIVIPLASSFCVGCDSGPRRPPLAAQRVVLEAEYASPVHPLSGTFADLDGDGLPGILVGEQDGAIHAYSYPGWERRMLSLGNGGADLLAADVDGDGWQDVISAGRHLAWYRNPGGPGLFAERVIAFGTRLRDMAAADVDGDGRLDLVGRDEAGESLWLLLQESPEWWTPVKLPSGSGGGGAAVADLDGDGRLDLLECGHYHAQGEQPRSGSSWRRVALAAWPPGCRVALADFDGDGDADVALADGGGHHRLSWFRNPLGDTGGTVAWEEQVAARSLGPVGCIRAADVDRDGAPDLVWSGKQGPLAAQVGALLNPGARGGGWSLRLLDDAGALDLAVADVGGDGRLEVLAVSSRSSPKVRLLTDLLPEAPRLVRRTPRLPGAAKHASAAMAGADPLDP